jgi:lipoprotein-anchoring transpeptidase ErfK/SrfK
MLRASTLFLVAVITASYAPAMCAQGFASAFPDLVERRIEIHAGKAKPGTIEIHTRARVLYFVLPSGRALRYPVGVGQLGKQWYGSTRIVSKRLSPPWTPPAVMRGERPPAVIPAGARNNPMGAAALVLADHELAIHGTNAPESIGEFASWGCIRMHNRHILDLYDRVEEGTPVLVMR